MGMIERRDCFSPSSCEPISMKDTPASFSWLPLPSLSFSKLGGKKASPLDALALNPSPPLL